MDLGSDPSSAVTHCASVGELPLLSDLSLLICEIVTEPGFGSARLTCNKVHLLTLGDGKGKYSVYCRCQARRTGSSCSKDLNSPKAFREGVLKAV